MNANTPLQPSFDPAYTVWLSRGDDLGQLLKTLATLLVLRPARLVNTWWQRHRERAQLLALDEPMLQDLGITHADAVGQWRKGFWQA
jgi:uncharacterized protein YjiS (DUF1127 family)